MRDYAKMVPTFWTGKTGKALKSKGVEAVVVAAYLLSSPHSNMLGLYYQPLLYMAHETGLGLEGATKGLAWACEVGFCAFDEASEMVWVYEMAGFQIAPNLKASDNRCMGIQKDYDSLQENPFLGVFFDKYSQSFHLSAKRYPSEKEEAPSKPLRSQEQEQEQEQEQDCAAKPLVVRQEKTKAEARFESFWLAYPRRIGKDAARKAFDKRKPDDLLLTTMLAAIEKQSQSAAWTKDGGQFIPNPATWLNQGRWMDGDTQEPPIREMFV